MRLMLWSLKHISVPQFPLGQNKDNDSSYLPHIVAVGIKCIYTTSVLFIYLFIYFFIVYISSFLYFFFLTLQYCSGFCHT